MEIYVPDYYKDFSCIASKCEHTCCEGWEIDIDDKTLKSYKNLQTDFGKRLIENIKEDNGFSHFILKKEDRCPFLNEDNLCDIILNLGENYLCQICSDHPRFRNFFSSRTEIGIGLCCEEAARIILTNKQKVKLAKISSFDNTQVSDGDEEIFFNFRSSLIKEIQDRDISIRKRIFNIVSKYKISFPYNTPKEWADFFLSLEQLNSGWNEMLSSIGNDEGALLSNSAFEIQAEQLLVYFIFRHLADGLYEGDLKERIAFSLLCVMMIDYVLSGLLKKQGVIDINDIIEISRLYSSEIEYSEENIKTILSALKI